MYWDVPRGASYGEKVMRKFKYTIKEEQGIHARPASFLIQEARTYESRITLRVKGKEADASNIIAVMALDVMCGQKVEVEICGTDEGVAYRGMKKFFEENLWRTFDFTVERTNPKKKIIYICDFSCCALNARLRTCIQTLLRGHKYRLFSSSDSVCGC